MSSQGLEVIDHTAHTTHEWINELAGRLDWSSKRNALRILRTTLQRVRDNLQIDECAQLSAQLPLLIRGMYFEGWVPKKTPIKDRSPDEFVASIEAKMAGVAEYRGTEDIACVFKLLNARLSAGEVQDVRACLPVAVRDLWPAP